MKKIINFLLIFLLIVQFNSCVIEAVTVNGNYAETNTSKTDDSFAAKSDEDGEPIKEKKKTKKSNESTFGDLLGKELGNYVSGELQPQLIKIYVTFIFYYAFFNGFLVYDTASFDEGEWTKNDIKVKDDKNEESVVQIEKAFIKKLNDDSEWWKVKYTDPKDNKTLIIEALFSGKNDGKVLQLKAKFPDGEIQNIKITENDTYFIKPLSMKSEFKSEVEKSTANITIGGLKISSNKISFTEPVTENTYEWFFSDKIPGKLAKVLYKEGEKSVEMRKKEGESNARANYFSSTVTEYGKNAKFELQ